MTPEIHEVFQKNFTPAPNFRGFCVCAKSFKLISFLFHIAKYGSCGLQDINHLDIDQVSQDIDTGFKGPISTSTFQGLILILRNK